jgi:ABC-2 type transport system ATP-binding protein
VPDVDSAVVLEARGLSKSYRFGHLRPRYRPVLTDLSLSVRQGEIFGYLGANGSGKTTTLKLLMGLLRPERGTARILGHDLKDRAWRYRAGYLPEHPYLYDYLTPREYLDYAGRLLGLPAPVRKARSRELLERVGLTRSADVPLRRFSKGMTQRAGLAQALINDPELVFLDEPMSGLDPLGRRLVRQLILDLKARGKTVFFSTHILSDAETLCDRVGVLRGGQLLRTGRLDEMLTLDVVHMDVLVTGVDAAVLPGGAVVAQRLGERLSLQVEEKAVVHVLQAVEGAGGRILSVNPVRESLEDYFYREVGEAGAAGGFED